jgi:hypothetical protein
MDRLLVLDLDLQSFEKFKVLDFDVLSNQTVRSLHGAYFKSLW